MYDNLKFSSEKYKDWIIIYNPKPIPIKAHDYDVVHEDYDYMPGSGDRKYFTTNSVINAKEIIDSWEEEE